MLIALLQRGESPLVGGLLLRVGVVSINVLSLKKLHRHKSVSQIIGQKILRLCVANICTVLPAVISFKNVRIFIPFRTDKVMDVLMSIFCPFLRRHIDRSFNEKCSFGLQNVPLMKNPLMLRLAVKCNPIAH